MAEPIVTIIGADKLKISDEPQMDRAIVTFSFDVPVQAYTVNVMGASFDTGTVAGSKEFTVQTMSQKTVSAQATETITQARQVSANESVQVEVDYTELYQEGDNRINIYGKALTGEWSTYNQS